jgi:CRISPR-associated endoribonuclease Cas6
MPGIVGDATALARHAEGIDDERELHWREWTRFSSRQKQEMTLGGVVGDWVIRGDLEPLMPWLWLGQWLHVGKNATMGMGSYSLEVR